MVKSIIYSLVLSVALILLCSSFSSAQSRHYNTQSLGMGGGGASYVDGYHSNFINPANLLIKTYKNKNSLGIAGGVGTSVSGNLANISVYNEYLTNGDIIEGQFRVDMLEKWFGDNVNNNRNASADVQVVPFGLSISRKKNAFSLATRTRVIPDLTINKGFAELLFYGLDSEKFGSAVPVNLDFNLTAVGEVSLAYARQIMAKDEFLFSRNFKLNVGIAPKYLIGAYSLNLDLKSDLTVLGPSNIDMGRVIHNFDYNVKTFGVLSKQLQEYDRAKKIDKEALIGDYIDYDGSDIGSLGSGFGLDIGVTAEMDISHISIPGLNVFGRNKKLRVAMSITDLGSVTFRDNPVKTYAKNSLIFDGDIGESTIGDYYENLGDSLANDVYGKIDTEVIGAQKYSLPSMYNFGTSININRLMLALDYGVGFNNNGINSRRSSLVLGGEYRFFGIIPLRLGTRIGGNSSVAYSLGTGLDLNFFEFTIAASLVNNSEKNGANLAAAYSGVVIRF